MVIPLLYFAKRFLNCEVRVELTPKLHSMFRCKPDCLILSNTRGSFLHFHAARAAQKGGIPVFALDSEGNFRTDNSYSFWGYNTAHELYQTYLCAWSKRTHEYLRQTYPHLKDRIVLTGAVGFDRYRIYDFVERRTLLARYNIRENQFRRVIGYAAWGFAKLSHKQGRRDMIHYFGGDKSKLKWAERQRSLLEELLRQSIEANPDTLYILKKHPLETVAGSGDPDYNEISALKRYPNVLYVIDEQIHDLINISDLWWVYESTTALEATMMGKQTLFVVPDPDFPRIGIHQGFPEASNHEEVERMTEHFFKTGSLPDFESEAMLARRQKVIEASIGFDDGYNHIRSAHYLEKTLKETIAEPTGRVSLYYAVAYWAIRFLSNLCPVGLFAKIPWIGRKAWVLERVDLKGYPSLEARYKTYLDRFYEKEQIEERYKDGSLYASKLPED